MTWHKAQPAPHPERRMCIVCRIPMWRILTIIAGAASFVGLIAWRVAALEVSSADMAKKVEAHAVSLGRMEYAIGIMERIEKRMERVDQKLDDHLANAHPAP